MQIRPEPAPPYNEYYSQTNFTGGPYHINALALQTVGQVSGDFIVLLGHLKTFGNGTATLDAKYYGTGVGGNPWNTELDTNPGAITWDCSYSFNFSGTMTRMLLFENGQFPFYVFGFRASTNFTRVVGLDPGYIKVSPSPNAFTGDPINMTNLAVEANPSSWASPPSGYGTLTYQWYQNGAPINGATSKYLNIASASLSDPTMPSGTDAGTYTCVATDPSATWGSVTNSVVITVTQLPPPSLTSVQMLHDQTTFVLTFNESNLTGASDATHYVFDNGIGVSNVSVVNNSNSTTVQLWTTGLPLGTKLSLTISGVTNVVGGTLGTTNVAMWTDLIQAGVANWDGWLYPALISQNDYFNDFVPANPIPTILQSVALGSWDGPSSGIAIVGGNGNTGEGFGGKLYGWFIPPVSTNYVFYISCDDGGRLSLSTNDSPANLRVIACESLWNGPNQWTNISDQYPGPGSPHRGMALRPGSVLPATSGTTRWREDRRPQPACKTAPISSLWPTTTARDCPADLPEQRTVGPTRSHRFMIAFRLKWLISGQMWTPTDRPSSHSKPGRCITWSWKTCKLPVTITKPSLIELRASRTRSHRPQRL